MLPFSISFAKKSDNVAGLQIADIVCNPIIHYTQNPATTRPDWVAVRERIRRSPTGRIMGWGLKSFP